MIDHKTCRHQILEILHEMGGSGTREEVLRIMQNRLQGRINLHDTSEVGLPPRPRWHHRMDTTRRIMVEEGLIRYGSPRGVWQLSGQGWLSAEHEGEDE